MLSEVVTAFFVLIGSGFMFLAGVGIVRMPDLFTRMQSSTKAATLGAGCLLCAVATHFGDAATASRAILVIGFVCATAPVAAHAIARAAYSAGTHFWKGTKMDELRDQIHRK